MSGAPPVSSPPGDEAPRGDSTAWEGGLGFFIAHGPIVFVLLLLIIGAGLYVVPLDLPLGDWPRDRVSVDAIPDLGENQQIVFTKWPGRSPRDIEDQVTYPLNTALLGIPGVHTVRSSSLFGFSSIYVIFEEGVDFYWARSRVLEKLASLPADMLPEGVAPVLGPDATVLGQVFWYTLEGRDAEGRVTGGWDLHELRTIQDWTVRFALQGVPGVAETASVGGYVREYQVDVDPEAMLAYKVSLAQVATAVRESNLDVGARTLEINRVEYVVRGLGFIEGLRDLEETVIDTRRHTPIRIRDVARVTLGPAQRRGALDDAGAETVGGVVVARYGANPLEVIRRVKQRITELAPGLPKRTLEDGTVSQVTIVPFYDRSELIGKTLDTLSDALLQQMLIVALVLLLMLHELRSALLIAALLPVAVLGTFAIMKIFGVEANIMALAGIAVAIGTMVDMGIVLLDNIMARRRTAPPGHSSTRVTARAAAEVAPAVLTSTLTTIVGFLPVFALTAAEGKLFNPLAITKSLAIAAALFIALLILPAMAGRMLRSAAAVVAQRRVKARHLALPAAGALLFQWYPAAGLLLLALGLLRLVETLLPAPWHKIPAWSGVLLAAAVLIGLLAEQWRPLERGTDSLLFVAGLTLGLILLLGLFRYCYAPLLRWCLRHPWSALAGPVLIVLLGGSAWLGFDRVFSLLPQGLRGTAPFQWLDRTFPGLSREFMPPFDEGSYLYMPSTMPHASIGQSLKMLRELDRVIQAIPEVERVVGKLGRVDSALDPAPISMFEIQVNYRPEYVSDEAGRRIRQWREHVRTPRDLWQEITRAAQSPGLTGAPLLMPISTRIVMLQSGLRAPLGIKVYGPDLESIESFGRRLEELLKELPSIRPETVLADRVVGKPYLEIVLDREALGRYGLSIRAVQEVLQIALGGQTLTRTVEGRERYPVRVRYLREERDSVEALRRVLVPAPDGAQIPLEQLAAIRYTKGPRAIKSENTFLTSYVVFDRHPEYSEVDAAEQVQAHLQQQIRIGRLEVPAGVSYKIAGNYEHQLRSEQRLRILVPLALLLIFLLLYLQFRNVPTALIAYSGVPLCIAGGFLLLWLYGGDYIPAISLPGTDLRELLRVGEVHLSVAVWVGFIALLGIATDNGVVLTTFLVQRFRKYPPRNREELRRQVLEAGCRRLRPCLMTTATTLLALLPVITSQGTGADVMLPMALPIVGGMGTVLLSLFTVPVLYAWLEQARLRRRTAATASQDPTA